MHDIVSESYRECTRCLMDTTDPDIRFDSEGICNWCLEAEARLPSFTFTPEESLRQTSYLVDKIKGAKSAPYDSVIGLSGGVDSSYLALWAKDQGLNPLAVHFDNGWNSEISVSNIKKIIDYCEFDLQTYVINWHEFRDLQRSFLKAGVVDIEILTDHAITAALRKLMKVNGIKYILSGANYSTEHGLPSAWVWPKYDWSNIQSIHKMYGEVKLKTYPHFTFFQGALESGLKLGGENYQPLDLMTYRKGMAMSDLSERVGWRYYGGKHYESVFTKFYQAYILPKKFGIDKRRSHLSCLIRNGEISKTEAEDELNQPLYTEAELKHDRQYVCKKLGFTLEEFEVLMSSRPVAHDSFSSSVPLRRWLGKLAKNFSTNH